MRGTCVVAVIVLLALQVMSGALAQERKESDCIICHTVVTPGIVNDWKASKMSETLGCETCHGHHTGPDDTDKLHMPTAKECGLCHTDQAQQFGEGKHALAWIAMEAMPRTAHLPGPIVGGLKGCGGCHRMGKDGGKCDSCHTRHKFNPNEARNPLACTTCHMGFDHPQYEMWSTSKHGVIHQLEPDSGRAPTCQVCHMDQGNHRVMTAWGFLGLRLPEPDEGWMADRATILKGLGVLDPKGEPTGRLEAVKAAKVARLTAEEWQAERNKMTDICRRCHSARHVTQHLTAGDQLLREADRLMAESIDTVAKLYDEGLLKPQPYQEFAYPDVLNFYDARTPIEQELYIMFMEYRMRTFQGAFHMNPDYQHWYGWAPMNKSLVDIRMEAQRMRDEVKR
ncbi:MAG: multiheme c-type cytochrome [Candidatus Zipacnadales bacterium]